jgi:hypothetical protein
MNLCSTFINRLTAIKHLLDLADVDLASEAFARFDEHVQGSALFETQAALLDHRYADAAKMIEKTLADGRNVVKWIDSEIPLLVAECELLANELADREAQHAELMHRIIRYQVGFYKYLGERLEKLLKLRMRKLLLESQTAPEKTPSYKQARKDLSDFEQERVMLSKKVEREMWNLFLSDTERKQLKYLFRQCCILCHPKLLAEEHKELAEHIFMELRQAYDESDLIGMRKLVDRCESGLFESIQRDEDLSDYKKMRLRSQITSVREALDFVRQDIKAIEESQTYHTMNLHSDWHTIFGQQADLLDQEILHLSEELER